MYSFNVMLLSKPSNGCKKFIVLMKVATVSNQHYPTIFFKYSRIFYLYLPGYQLKSVKVSLKVLNICSTIWHTYVHCIYTYIIRSMA